MRNIILASQSPRRKQLLEQAGYQFSVIVADVDETNPPGMPGADVPEFLAHKKAEAIQHLTPDDLIIAADTIVLLDNDILGKPVDNTHAQQMLQRLSGRMHSVVTGVCMRQGDRVISFSVLTEVYFRPLTAEQITHYITHYHPLDKAGAYAIQEWIGMVGIEKIVGDYYNVMGLPISEVVSRMSFFD